MISYSAAATEVLACRIADQYRMDETRVDLLTSALSRSAKSTEDARDILRHIIAYPPKFTPTVSDLEAAASAVHASSTPEYSLTEGSNCECGGTAFIHTVDANGYEFSAPCKNCHPLGRRA